jgi:hypothetical protein
MDIKEILKDKDKIDFMTKKDTAEFLHCSEKSIDRLRKEGLPCYDLSSTKPGGKILFLKGEVAQWIIENKKMK